MKFYRLFLQRRSVTAQFRLALQAMAVLMTLGSLGLLFLAQSAASRASRLYEHHLWPLTRLNVVVEEYTVGITGVLRAVRSGGMSPSEGIVRLGREQALARSAWEEFRAIHPSGPHVAEVHAQVCDIEKLLPELEGKLQLGISRELGSYGDHTWLPRVTALSESIEKLRQEQAQTAREMIRRLEGQAKWTTLGGLLLLTAALGLALLLSHLLTARIRREVKATLGRLRMVAGQTGPLPEHGIGEDELSAANRELDLTLIRMQRLMKRLQEQDAFQRALLDGASAAIIGLDTDGKVNCWNRAAEEMLGYKAAEVMGTATPSLWRLPDELDQLARQLSEQLGRPLDPDIEVLQAAATVPDFSTECHYRHRDGHLTPVLLGISQVRTPDGQLLGTMGVAIDLSKIKALEAELRGSEMRYRQLAERLPDVVYQTRIWPDGRRIWTFISPQFQTFYGTDARVMDENPSYSTEKIHPDDLAGFQACFREATQRMGAMDWEGRSFTERPGEIKWVRVRRNPTPQADGSVLWDGVLEDITKLKEAEEELRRSEARAQEASKAKSAFLANMSHELRTPLSVILGYTGLLVKDAGRSASDLDQLEKIQHAGEHLLTLINDVLSLTKIEAGHMEAHAQTFAPKRLFADLESLFRLSANDRGLVFEIRAEGFPEQVEGDHPKLRQILVNLLSNAFKFTAQGQVSVRASWKAGRAEFSVDDSGPGISPEDQANLFQAFQQTEQGASAGGTGLGLHISRSLVTLLGGELNLESAVGQGSRFHFTIPLEESDLLAITVSGQGILRLDPEQGARVILIVDDRPENREILSTLLRRIGFSCITAENGVAGIARWESEHPDLVLMDLRMPVMDGFIAIDRLRQRETELGWLHTPVVAVSASVYDVSLETLVGLGFDDFLTKPVAEERLLESIGRLLSLAYLTSASDHAGRYVGNDLSGLRDLDAAWRDRFRSEILMGDLEAAEDMLSELPDGGLPHALHQRLKAYNLQDLLDHLS